MATQTRRLITDLEQMDEQEARIHGRLLKQLEDLEQRELRERSVTVGDLQGLQTALDELQAKLTGAQAAAAAPETSPTFAQLEAQVREHDATAQRVRELLAERLQRLAPHAGDDDHDRDHDDAHPAETYVLRQPLLKSAGIQAFQRVLNHQYEVWGIHRQITENGVYGPETREATQQIALGLGLLKSDYEDGITPQLRILIRNPERRTPLQTKRFESVQRRRYRAALRKHYTTVRPSVNGNGNGDGTVIKASGGGIAAAIRRHGGRWEDAIVREAADFELPVSLLCAVIENESGFTNVFGHDGRPGHTNTIKSPPRPAPDLVVTQELYAEYLRQRKLGRGEQGVGPMQLTSAGLQDDADHSGGCWKPEVNIRIGAKTLARHIARLGLQRGVQRYNGAVGLDYSTDVLKRKAVWDERLAGASSANASGPTPKPKPKPGGSPGGVPPTFTLRRPPLRSARVLAFQRVLNRRFAAMKIGRAVAEDGVYGVETARAARQAALALGLLPADYARGVTPLLRVLIRTPTRRSPAQKRRARSRERVTYRARLRKRYGRVQGAGGGSPVAGGARPVPGGRLVYPLTVRGMFNGGIDAHKANAGGLSGWQSINAVDINVPRGTPVLAVADATITQLGGAWNGGGGKTDGLRITLDAGDRSWWYGHLMGREPLKVGQKVKAGQRIGTSGAGVGVDHLHIASSTGDPEQLLGVKR